MTAATIPARGAVNPERALGPLLDMAWLGLLALPLIAIEHALADPEQWAGYLAYTLPPVLGCAACVAWAGRDPRIARAAAWGVSAFFFVVSAAFVAGLLVWGHYPLYARQAPFTSLAFAVGIVWNGVYLGTAAALLLWLWRSRIRPAVEAVRLVDELALFRDDVRRYCLGRTSDPVAAEDLTQDVFVVALRRADSYRGDALLVDAPGRAWLLGIARNVVRTHHRDRATAGRALDRLSQELAVSAGSILPVHAPDPEERARLSEQLGALQRARRRLAPGQDEALRLRFDADLTSEQAAAVLGTTAGAYRVRLHRTVKLLRSWLAPDQQA